MFKILFGCDGSTAVTTEAPEWQYRQRGRIADKANGLIQHGDSDALFAAEVHSFLRGKLNHQSPSVWPRLSGFKSSNRFVPSGQSSRVG
jgi:hypothetical protein